MKTKILWLMALIMAPLISNAQSTISTVEDSIKKWSTEAQFNTSSNSNSATFGPSMLYHLNNRSQVGLKLLMPIGVPYSGTTSVIALYRQLLSQKTTNLFVEGSVGANWYNFEHSQVNINITSPSIGTNFGVLHNITDHIAFGGLAGIEWTQVRLGKNLAIEEPNSVFAWGRIALFGSLKF
ncbi:MAG: hypothetical protein HOO06_15655 [Bdellovibrionaceae bacterium]|jgi:hypothetical protein|nr:hypothetical protein [Pseudobdellovibrionaceae bacterium]